MKASKIYSMRGCIVDDPDDDGALSMWVIYSHPRDYPNAYVARRHVCTPPHGTPTGDVLIAPDLDTLRSVLAAHGLVCMPRHPSDHPVIIEVWM